VQNVAPFAGCEHERVDVRVVVVVRAAQRTDREQDRLAAGKGNRPAVGSFAFFRCDLYQLACLAAVLIERVEPRARRRRIDDRVVGPGNPAGTGTAPTGAPVGRRRLPRGAGGAYRYDELVQRDKCSLDIFWLWDESLEDSDNLPSPDVIAAEIIEDLRAAQERFAEIQSDLSRKPA
jgi:hypothetical protein